MSDISWRNSETVQRIVDYIQSYRVRAHVDVGTIHKGGDDWSPMAEHVHGELAFTAEFEGPWQKLADPIHAASVWSFIQSQQRRRCSRGVPA